jgi:octaprenyl-diphosphate synthase
MQRGTSAERETIQQAVESGDVGMLDDVIRIVKTTGALDVARLAAQTEAMRAIKAASRLPEGPHRECLVHLASQLLDRNH